MMQISRKSVCESPTHIIKCSRTSDSAFVVSIPSKTYTKYTWSNANEDDMEKINEVNDKLPDCQEIKKVITGKIGKKLAHIYLCEKIISFEDERVLEIPDAIFLQRVSPYTKTFDMVCFYGNKYEMISIVDKADLGVIREWYPNKIYSCGADPLPLSSVTKYLEKQKDNKYDKLFAELTQESESSASEYQVSSSESDEEYISDEDDEIEEQTASELEEEEDSEYEAHESEAHESEDEEPPSKKIKL